ncbi:multidrug transporter AcrB [Fulvitalea axinellae]|uniref:Multidrug transporter AcrB n=1 Tax=Fulvitalea axinellae TaxID=1182444 RepID=A0AAU9CSQ2_9BACT|nr:multidrug transporter AcrB [Fulvitalea axinellae]
MNLSEFSIKRSRVTFTLLFVIMVMGVSMYKKLPQDSMPPYTVRVAQVIASFPGASPDRVERLVADKIEKRVQEIPEVKQISSQSRTGLAVIGITVKDQVAKEDLQKIWDLVRRKMQALSLPEGVHWELRDDGVGEVYGISLGLISDGLPYDEMKDYADDIRDALVKLPDAAKVEIGGAQEERVYVDFDNARLARYGLTVGQLKNLIASRNILVSGGTISQGEESVILEPTGNFDRVEELKRMLVPVGESGEVVYLGDITNIHKGYISPAKSFVRVNGQKALSLAISLKKGANIVRLGEDVNRAVDTLIDDLPVGLSLVRLTSMDEFVSTSVDDFMSNLLQSVAIVLLVMLIFLGMRTGFVISSLIPMVTLATLLVMGLIGMGLNQVTLAALIMALGMMVDNAVVVSESIMVKMEEGADRMTAAVDSCKELFIPLLISTLTTSVAFLSFYLAESVMGEIMGPIFVVITIALLASWIISLSMIALLCYFFIKVNGPGEEQKLSFFDKFIEFMKSKYEMLIHVALRKRVLVLFSVLGMFFLSFFGFGLVPFIFFPDSERNLVTVDINLPLGVKIEATETVVEEIETFIKKELQAEDKKVVVDWSSYIGQGPESYDLGYAPDEANSNYAHMLINTTSADMNERAISSLDDFCFERFPTADIKVKRLGSAGGGTPIEIEIIGDDPAKLFEVSESVKQMLVGISGTKNVKDNWGPRTKKLVIDIDQAKAQQAGVTNQDIAVSLSSALTGVKTGEFREGDQSLAIVMRNEKGESLDIDRLRGVNIYAQQSGKAVPLSQVARIVPKWQYAQIRRKDLDRTITVSSQLREGVTASEVTNALVPALEESVVNWPKGITYELGGDSKQSAENMGAVIDYLPLCGFLIVLLLIIQFNSMRKTLIVLCSIPLGIIGVVLGLILLRSYFGFMAFLGVISLAGIVVNNAIVLIDRIEIELETEGVEAYDAVVGACLQRFRPILLTTLTTVLGMIPLYLGGGIMWEPMAASIMVGLMFGTVITLLFVPAFYSVLYKVKNPETAPIAEDLETA